MDILDFLKNGKNYFIPNLSIDHVIIGYTEGKLKCLLLRIGEQWALPGGFVKKEESVDEAHVRILKERTNLENPHSNFLAVFGANDRSFGDQWKDLLEKIGIPWKSEYWINDRFVTIVYFSLVNMSLINPEPGEYFDEIKWIDFDKLPDMWVDHKSIAQEARNRLKSEIKLHPVSYNLLPEEFTMPELHQLHQTILDEQLDRSRFQKNMLASNLFERLPKLQKETPGRNPYLYKVKT